MTDQPFVRQTIMWRGRALSALTRGGRSPGLVMLHGLCCGAVYFEEAFSADALGEQALVALDLPGFGESASLGSCTLDEMADAVIVSIKEFGLVRPVIAAHSMAAAIVARLTNEASGIVLLEGNILPAHLKFSDQLIAGGEAGFELQFTRMQKTAAMILRFQARYANPDRLRRCAETWMMCCPSTIWPLVNAFNPEVRAGTVHAKLEAGGPLLCLFGTSGDYAATTPDIAHVLRHARLQAIDRADHYLMLDAPADTYSSIGKFIKSIEGHA